MKLGKFTIILAIFLSLTAYAGPARMGSIYLSQPDGSGFYARYAGDEWMKVKMTEDGCAITQARDGWWYYAVYDTYGRKSATSYRVGSDVPRNVLQASRQIPFDRLAQMASLARYPVRKKEITERSMLRKLKAGSLSDEPAVKYGLVILAEYKGLNEKFTHSRDEFVNLLMQDGYSVNGATGSAKEYFEDQFQGKFRFQFDVTDIVTLPKNRAYYGENDEDDTDLRPHEMIVDACRQLEGKVDFSRYDQDGDHEVDNVFLFFAGNDEAEGADSDHVWSHAWYVADGAGISLTIGGVKINRYACASELMKKDGKDVMTSIGTFCHEYCHTFGLPDMYDTDYQVGGYSAALWRMNSLMDAGNYNNDGNTPPNLNAVEREYISLSAPVVLEEDGSYELQPITSGQYYRLDTDNPGEYFLFECRVRTGWDSAIGGEGMLVYHIDRSDKDSGYSEVLDKNALAYQRWDFTNEVNALAEHQCADMIEADGRREIYRSYQDPEYKQAYMDQKGLFFPFGRSNVLTPSSVPGLKGWDRANVAMGLLDITYDGQSVRFNAKRFVQPADVVVDVFQDDAVLTFGSAGIAPEKAKVIYGPTDGIKKEVVISAYEQGRWAMILDSLEPSTSYKVSVAFVDDDGVVGITAEKSFLTKKQRSESALPYIYLSTVGRTGSGLFPPGTKLPLKLFNARHAAEVRWTFNDSPIEVAEDYYYEVKGSGTLKAHIIWSDGSEEVIVKQIRISDE